MEEEQNLGEPGDARAATVSGQKSLTELLDEIEQRAKRMEPQFPTFRLISTDVPALVNALRRAIQTLDKASLPGVFNLRARCDMALHDVAQLLSEPADSVPSGSKLLTPPGKQKPVLIEPAEQKEKL